MSAGRFYESPGSGARRSAPAALRNREPIANILAEWLPPTGIVLEIASGTGEHVVYFAKRFQNLEWQPSDVEPGAIRSIAAWREDAQLANVKKPLVIDAASADWPVERADAVLSKTMPPDSSEPSRTIENKGFCAVLSINMAHISPWSASLGLLNGSAKVLQTGGALILYGPWLKADVPTAASNLIFDQQLRERDPEWGLRKVEDFQAEAEKRGFVLEQVRAMPANNLMLLFRFDG